MALTIKNARLEQEDRTVPGGRRVSLGVVLALLVLVQGSALGLKAWEERQSSDIADLEKLQRDAALSVERIAGTAAAVRAFLTHSNQSPTSQELPFGLDLIIPMAELNVAATGGRLGDAAALFRQAPDNEWFGLTASGDLAVRSADKSGQFMVALTRTEAWVPRAGADRQLTLAGRDQISQSFGDDAIALARPQPQAPRLGFFGGWGEPRQAEACLTLSGSSLSLCLTQPAPAFATSDAVRLIIYLLLLIAPALALLGLNAILQRERETTEDALEQRAELQTAFDTAMNRAEAGYWQWSLASRQCELGGDMAKLIHTSPGTLSTLDDYIDTIHPDDRKDFAKAIDASRKSGLINISHRLNDPQQVRWIELRGRSDTQNANGAFIDFSGIGMDITERKLADNRLVAAERNLRVAIESFSGPFAIWDQKKRLLYWNGAFAKAFQLQDTLRRGMGHETILIARTPAVKQERLSKKDPQTVLLNLFDNSWLKLVERRTSSGGLVTVGVDVTETIDSHETLTRQQGRLQRAIADLERSEGRAAEMAHKYSIEKARAEHAAHSKSAFLANMSHELRTPLNAINGFSEILSNELFGPLGDDRYKGYANDILESGNHLLDMINDILDMAKIEAGGLNIDLQLIDPVDPVDAAIRMIRRKAEDKGLTVVFEADEDLPKIDADHRAIKQMVLNLISNAIKFTDSGGRVAISVGQKKPGTLSITVSDNGVGIPEADLPRLAKPFEQVNENRDREYGGTGLGLALTKSFAEMHGGKLQIASQEGRGTTVMILLPMSQPIEDIQPPNPPAQNSDVLSA